MLKEIRSDTLLRKKVEFHKGLNVVLGDDDGTNSIGKSNLLMIIDFIFGGETYITHNLDVVENIGHHEYQFMFDFSGEQLYFCRGTKEHEYVYKCNKDYEKITRMKLSDYNKLLKRYYNLTHLPLTFRSTVSLYSRVWGKGNYDVKKPLHIVSNESFANSITRLIKLFNEYKNIEKEDHEIKELKKTREARNKAGRLNIIPKITKKTLESNKSEIEELKDKINELSKSLYSPIINITEMVSDEVLELREQKRDLLNQLEYGKSRLKRMNTNINKSINTKFEGLIRFFPDVNLERIKEIEEFHSGIRRILNNQLRKSKKDLTQKINILNEGLLETNEKLDKILNPNEEPNIFVDNLIETSSRLRKLQIQNESYEELENLKKSINEKEIALDNVKENVVKEIRSDVNKEIKDIYTTVYNEQSSPPELYLTPNKYEYRYLDNTGTGNAYVNLTVLDIAILKLTDLPFIIHDSFLFKNIEKNAVENLINFYSTFNKQVFLAIDAINIYDKKIQEILNMNSVIKLTKRNILFTKDWKAKETN